MDEWKAARKPIEQRLSGARKQLAKVSRTHVLDGYVGNGKGLRADGTRSTSASSTRSSPPSSIRSWSARPGAATTASTNRA